jgi:hypothetical protein
VIAAEIPSSLSLSLPGQEYQPALLEEVDYLKVTVMNKIRLRREKSPASSEILTAAMFLGKNGSTPYVDAKTLLNFIDNARTEDVDEMESFFNLVKEELKMAINRRVNTDRGGNSYKYENFLRPKGPEGVKVQMVGDIQRFITDYQAGKFTIDFTLEELVTEAELS